MTYDVEIADHRVTVTLEADGASRDEAFEEAKELARGYAPGSGPCKTEVVSASPLVVRATVVFHGHARQNDLAQAQANGRRASSTPRSEVVRPTNKDSDEALACYKMQMDRSELDDPPASWRLPHWVRWDKRTRTFSAPGRP